MDLQIKIPEPKYTIGDTVRVENGETGIITGFPELTQHELSISGRVEMLIIDYEYTVMVKKANGSHLFNYTEQELDKERESNMKKKKLIRGSTLIFNESDGGFTKDKEYKVNYYYEGWLWFDGDNGRNAIHENNDKIDWERSEI